MLVYLQEALNRSEYIDELHEAHTQSKLSSSSSPIPVFRLPDAQFVVGTTNIEEPGYWTLAIPRYTPGEGGELWEARYAQFLEGLSADEHSMLCEGYFPHPSKFGVAMRVLVRVKCFANEEGDTKWRIVGHAFRVA